MEDCTTWEENIYWNHFNTFHFTLVLSQDFHDHLVLPKKFALHMKSYLPDKVSLKGPSGALWEVQLFKTDELRFVGSEWKDFIKAHDLKENCRLFFKFKRNSIFEVVIFDQWSSCEKESTYFVKKCRNLKYDDEDHRKRIKGDDNIEVVEGEVEEDTAFVVAKKSRRDVRPEVSAGETQTMRVPYTARIRRGRPRKVQARVSGKESLIKEVGEEPIQELQGDIIAPENGESLSKNDHSQKLMARSEKQPNGDHTEKDSSEILKRGLNTPLSEKASEHPQKSKPQSEEPSGNLSAKKQSRNSGRVVITPDYRESSLEDDHSPKSRGTRGRTKKEKNSKSSKKLEFKSEGHLKEHKSNRRSVSDKEIKEAFQKATTRETENSFTTILPKTSVSNRFYLSVPIKWLHDHLPLRKQEAVLRVGAEIWSTTLFYQAKKGAGFSTGWKKFALDNNLKELDVLVFKLTSPKDTTPVLFDVDIFRVVPITTPPLSETS